MTSYNNNRSHSRNPSNLSHVQTVTRSRSPSVNSQIQPPISRTPSPNFRQHNNMKPLPPDPVPSPPPGVKPTPEIHIHKTTELHERLPRGPASEASPPMVSTEVVGRQDTSSANDARPQRKVPNAYYLKRKMSEPEKLDAQTPLKHKPFALNLPPNIPSHGFPEDPNRPISQRPFSEHYPWPYDPSSYYNMARSPTVATHPKPKAYPVGWEENGGLSRPVSMGGIDLPIPLSPMPPVPGIPEQYKKEQVEERVEPEPRILYDQERDGLHGQVSNKKIMKQQQKEQKAEKQRRPSETATTQDSCEYIPQASPSESLVELWEFAAHGKLLSTRVTKKVSIPKPHQTIPEGVYVLNMYRGAPLNQPQQLPTGGFIPEHFAFGPTPSHPFYTVQALPDALHPNNPTVFNPHDPATFFNDVLILRRNPVTHKDTSVLTMGLNPHAAKAHRQRLAIAAHGQQQQISPTQGDELITLIYPKQAAMMAIDSSAIHVDDKTGRIVGGDAQTMAREAVERAAETECCRLSWDVARDRYYLYHPGVGRGGEVYLVIIDDENYTQPRSTKPAVGFDIPGAKGSIKLINVDTSEAIVVLDFKSGLLFVNTMATRKIPSLYIVDVAVSTVLAVAVVEGRRVRDQQLFELSQMQGIVHLGDGYSQSTVNNARGGDAKYAGGHHGTVSSAGGGWSDSTLGMSFTDIATTQTHEKTGGRRTVPHGAGRSGGTGSVEAERNNSSDGALDLAGMIVNGFLTVLAWILGLFWAIGGGIGRVFRRGKKSEGDIEQGTRNAG